MTRHIILLSLALFFLSYCQPKTNEEESEQTEKVEEFDNKSAELSEKFSSMMATISMGELAAQLEAIGADYNGAFLHDPAKASSYLTSEEVAAANLGIYYVDMIYAASYEKADVAKALYQASQTLADTVGLGRYFNQAVLNRLESEMTDETRQMVYNAMSESSKNLNMENRDRISALLLGSVLIERVHLLGSIIDQSEEVPGLTAEQRSVLISPAMRGVMKQRDDFEKVVDYINEIKTDADPVYFPKISNIQYQFEQLAQYASEIEGDQAVDPTVMDDLFAAVDEARATIMGESTF